jgi:hypothetical protein
MCFHGWVGYALVRSRHRNCSRLAGSKPEARSRRRIARYKHAVKCSGIRSRPAEAVIEARLAHGVKDSLGRAYNRTEFLEQRRKMLQTWADYPDKLCTGAEIIPIKRSRIRSAGRTPASDKMR